MVNRWLLCLLCPQAGDRATDQPRFSAGRSWAGETVRNCVKFSAVFQRICSENGSNADDRPNRTFNARCYLAERGKF